MKSKNRLIKILVLPVLLLFFLGVPSQGHQDSFKLMGIVKPKRVKPAPSFSSVDLNGKKINLEDFKGKSILLNFWATWCVPCRKELSSMQHLYENFPKKGLEILAVSIDRGNTDRVKKYVDKHNLTFSVLVDPDQKVRKKYYVMGLPTSYLIDKKGNLRGFVSGERKWDSSLSEAVMLSLE